MQQSEWYCDRDRAEANVVNKQNLLESPDGCTCLSVQAWHSSAACYLMAPAHDEMNNQE